MSARPTHVAIIMDGNGRWARRRALPRVFGHRAGVEAVRTAVRACGELGVRYLTLYTFSSENWQRPKREVGELMKMLEHLLTAEEPELQRNQVRVRAIGRTADLPAPIQRRLRTLVERTAANPGLVLTLGLSYGGRNEIVDAARRFATAAGRDRSVLDRLDAATFRTFLDDPELPDVDLLIRTGGEARISNFLLWQIAYAELYLTDTLWPDFGKPELLAALDDFAKRERRFGRVGESS